RPPQMSEQPSATTATLLSLDIGSSLPRRVRFEWMGSSVKESVVGRRWADLAGRRGPECWILGASENVAAGRAVVAHFFDEVEDELTHHRIAIEDLRRQVQSLQVKRKGVGKTSARSK